MESSQTNLTQANISLSYLIVNWNGGDIVKRCIDSIESDASSLENCTWEIVVLDNASRDLDLEYFNNEKNLKLVRKSTNLRFAKGTNESVEASVGNMLFILNNDVILQEGCTHRLLKAYQNTGADVVVPRLVYPDGTLQRSITRMPELWDVFVAFSGLGKLFPSIDRWANLSFDYGKSTFTTDQPLFSALMTSRSTWKKVGDLDEQFPLFWNDVDWFFRLYKEKCTCYFESAAVAVHHHGFSTKKLSYKRILESTRSAYRYFHKHFDLTFAQRVGLVVTRSIGVCSGFVLDTFRLFVARLRG